MIVTVIDKHGTPHRIDKEVKPIFDVLARQSGNRYLVLASNDGDLFDPSGSASRKERDRKRGGMFWKLRTCGQKCYDQYIIFLRSKNRTPYILSQRSFRNDFR